MTVTSIVGGLFYFTIQNNIDIDREVFECGGILIPEGRVPDWIEDRIPAASYLNPVTWIHCTGELPVHKSPLLHGRWLMHTNARVSTDLIKVLAKNDFIDQVHFDFTGLNDSHLESLGASDNITLLGISGTKCTDAGMRHLQKYKHLESLYVCELRLTDAGAAEIAKCRTLKYVNIYDTAIGPAGFGKLFELPNLETLVVSDKKEFKESLAKLKAKHPKVKVVEFEPATDEEGNSPAKVEAANPRRVRELDNDDLLKLLRKALQK